MPFETAVALMLSVAALFYLLHALIRPEKY
jgi:hypothetical protein